MTLQQQHQLLPQLQQQQLQQQQQRQSLRPYRVNWIPLLAENARNVIRSVKHVKEAADVVAENKQVIW
jgi:hypothetical protein